MQEAVQKDITIGRRARSNAIIGRQQDQDQDQQAQTGTTANPQQTLGNQALRSRALSQSQQAPSDQTASQPQQAQPAQQSAPQQQTEQAQTTSDPRLPDPLPRGEKVTMKSLKGAHLRDFQKVDNNGDTVYKVQEAVMVGPKIKIRNEYEVFHDVTDETGNWILARFGGKFGFIRSSKVAKGLGGAQKDLAKRIEEASAGGPKKSVGEVVQTPEEEEKPFDEFAENYGEALEGLLTGPGAASEAYDELIDESDEEIEKLTESIAVREGVMSKTKEKSLIHRIAKSQKEKLEGQKQEKEADKERMEQINAKIGVLTAPTEAVKAGLGGIVACKKIYDTIKDKDKSKGEKAWDITEHSLDLAKAGTEGVGAVAKYGESLNTLGGNSGAAEGFKSVGEWAGSVGEAISAIKSTFFMVKGIYETFQKAFSEEGISGGEIAEASLSIILNGLEAAKSAVSTVKSILEILQLGTGALSTAIPGIGIAISAVKITISVYEMIKSSVHTYKMTKAKRSFKDKYKDRDYVGKKEYKLFGKTLFRGRNLGTDKEKLEARKAELAGKDDDASKQELREIEEYELAKEMKNINVKRLKRAGFKIGLEMMNIAGDVATLSGYGATVGVPLKAVAAGANIGMSIGRKIKQWGRDRAAKPGAWGITKAVFDASKSSDAKKAKREKDANMILQMIADLPEYVPGDEGIKEQYRRVENYIESTGVSLRAFYRLNGKPAEQKKLLIEAMAKRE